MDRGHQAAVDQRGGIRLRRQVLQRQGRDHRAEAAAEAASGDHERRRLAQGTAVRRAICRRQLHQSRRPRLRGRARARRCLAQDRLGRMQARDPGLDQRLHLPGRHGSGRPRVLQGVRVRKGRLGGRGKSRQHDGTEFAFDPGAGAAKSQGAFHRRLGRLSADRHQGASRRWPGDAAARRLRRYRAHLAAVYRGHAAFQGGDFPAGAAGGAAH
jgi:hypothetical protein